MAWAPTDEAGLGIWFTPSTSTCFKNTAATTPVTADGDTVLAIRDNITGAILAKSGSAIYRTGGGKPYLEFAGTNLFGGASVPGLIDASGQYTASVAAQVDNTTAAHLMNFGGGATGLGTILSTGGLIQAQVSDAGQTNRIDNGPAFTVGTPFAAVSVVQTTSIECFVDGVSNGATVLSSALKTSYSTSASVFGLTGRLYGWVEYAKPLSSTSRANLEGYLTSLYAAAPASATGTAVGSISFTGSSASTVAIAATASGSVGLTGASASKVAIAATGAGSVAITGAASGAVALSAASGGTFDLTGSIAGVVAVSASASGSLPVTGSATGALGTTITASASGSLGLNGSANAAVTVSAAATGEFALSGSAGASVAIIGAVSGYVALTGASVATIADNIATGTASGTLGLSGSAQVAVLIRASANDNLALTGSARAGGAPPPTPSRRTSHSAARMGASSSPPVQRTTYSPKRAA